jgi:uncharacterized protein YkwD
MFPALPVDLSPRTVRSAQDIPPLDELERQLFEAVNRERASRGIPALSPNPALYELARRQSQDMARFGLLAHLSATAETLTERLRKAGVFFVANAENVARSDSFDPALIHESLMRSPEHRQAILNPAFDRAGMAIVRGSDGAYYTTQEFIRIWTPLDEPEMRNRVLEALDDAARERGSAPLTPVDGIHRTARVFAREKGAGRELPAIPPEYGTTAVRFVTGGDLEGLLASVRSIAEERFRFVGVGSWFGRTPENPGGAYVVCVFLLSGTQVMDLSDAERRQAVLDGLNEIRAGRGRRPLELDPEMCRKADEYNRRYQQQSLSGPPRGPYMAVWFYKTPELGRVPDGLRNAVGDKALRKAGISVLRLETGAGFSVNFSVAVLLED